MSEFLDYLGEEAETPQIASALEDAESLFEAETNRTFSAPITGRTEVYDGSGSNVLFLDYPVQALTSVKLGYDALNPVETLAVNDQSVLNWAVGSPRLVRVSGWFGRPGQPNYVQVVYNTKDDRPAAVKAAIKAGGKLLYQLTQGSGGDVTGERIGPYSIEYASGSESGSGLDSLDAWADAVEAYQRPVMS
jgi:hypothetical protein